MKDIQLPQVAFKRFWFWSDWVDVCAFTYCSQGYILQMRRNRFGALKFRTAKLCGYFQFGVAAAAIEDLPRTKNGN